jgi:O-succinylbenzoate synthase
MPTVSEVTESNLELFQQLVELADVMDQMTVAGVDELGLLDVVVALSRWRDSLG